MKTPKKKKKTTSFQTLINAMMQFIWINTSNLSYRHRLIVLQLYLIGRDWRCDVPSELVST